MSHCLQKDRSKGRIASFHGTSNLCYLNSFSPAREVWTCLSTFLVPDWTSSLGMATGNWKKNDLLTYYQGRQLCISVVRARLGYQTAVWCCTFGIHHKFKKGKCSLPTLHDFITWECHEELGDEFAVMAGCWVYPYSDVSGNTTCVPCHTAHYCLCQ